MKRRQVSLDSTKLILGICLIVLGITSIVAVNKSFASWEVGTIFAVYEQTAGVAGIFYLLTQLGSLWMVLVSAVGAVIKGSRKLALELLVSGFGAYAIAGLMKVLINRPRPSGLIEGLVPRYEEAVGLGFPSGHSALASALATTLWFVMPKQYRILLVLWVVLVGISRIALGLHAPLDIIGGLAIGIGTGVSTQYLFSKQLYRLKGKVLTAYAKAKKS